jgi:RNA polymerase sigma factor (TIGR02999 family)
MDSLHAIAAPDAGPGPVTEVLNRALAGDEVAHERLYELLYAELLRLARSHLGDIGNASLNPAVLVHEAYLRMLGRDGAPMRDRRAFYAYASRAMRSVLVDHVRGRAAEKRGGGHAPLTLTTGVINGVAATQDFERLDDALQALRAIDERCFRVVELRYFAGLGEAEVALELGVSEPTVKRDWRKARAFLFEQLR